MADRFPPTPQSAGALGPPDRHPPTAVGVATPPPPPPPNRGRAARSAPMGPLRRLLRACSGTVRDAAGAVGHAVAGLFAHRARHGRA